MILVFIPQETEAGEQRAAATPDTVALMIKRGVAVSIQTGAGAGAGHEDSDYTKAGASIAPTAAAGYAEADVVMKLHAPSEEEIAAMKAGTTLISFLFPTLDPGRVDQLRQKNIRALAMELIPRITRAQKMDALSSQANLAGYKAVLLAADRMPKIFPMLMTAAGTIHPCHVVILGAGVAGLQAIATAKRLGAVVEVSDVRPAVKEQVESLGGRYIEVPADEGSEDIEDAGGYAKEQSEEFLARQRALVRERIIEADAVITTAAIPGRRAPMLIPADMVADMKSGAVIVDLAVETGGNCELSEPGKTVVAHGVTIVGERNVPSLLAHDASEMYSKNVFNLLIELIDEGELKFDLEDEVIKGSLVTHGGEVLHEGVAEAMRAGKAS